MTRPYIARRLLEHGPLTFGEFLTITGWSKGLCNNALMRARKAGAVDRKNIDGRSTYVLRSAA